MHGIDALPPLSDWLVYWRNVRTSAGADRLPAAVGDHRPSYARCVVLASDLVRQMAQDVFAGQITNLHNLAKTRIDVIR